MRKILLNRAECAKCGDVIVSAHVHDFVSCKCGAIFVDGGNEYLRRGGVQMESIIERSVTKEIPEDEEDDDPHDQRWW